MPGRTSTGIAPRRSRGSCAPPASRWRRSARPHRRWGGTGAARRSPGATGASRAPSRGSPEAPPRTPLRGSQRLVLVVAETQSRRGDVLLQVRYRARTGNRQHRGRAVQQPRERYLGLAGFVCPGGPAPGPRVLADPARHERKPRNEREAPALAEVDERVGVPLGDAVAVLDRDHGDDLPRPVDLLRGYVGEADVPDLPLRAKLGDRPNGLLERHVRVGPVQLVEIDAIEA